MKLPVVTTENLFYCKDMLFSLTARRGSLLHSIEIGKRPWVSWPEVGYTESLDSPDEVNALLFGLALLVNSFVAAEAEKEAAVQ